MKKTLVQYAHCVSQPYTLNSVDHAHSISAKVCQTFSHFDMMHRQNSVKLMNEDTR